MAKDSPVFFTIFCTILLPCLFLAKDVFSKSVKPTDHPLMGVFRQFFDERKHAKQVGTFGSGYRFTQYCTLTSDVRREIAGYSNVVQKIVGTAMNGKFKGKSYNELALFVDLFGHRIPGGEVMEQAMSFLDEKMADIGLANLHEEEAKIPVWARGVESASLIHPVELELNIRGLGLSVETPAEGIIAEVVVVHNFEHLEEQKENVEGKIVIFNSKIGEAHPHLLFGPSAAAKLGAVAVLCRSPIKMVYSSVVLYEPNAPKIPAAVISREDADRLERLAEREEDVTVYIRMINQVTGDRMSRNIFGDFPTKGELAGKEFLLMMSHAGSWDVGEGVQDDGVGIILGMQVLKLFKYLELSPRRTVRNGIFTSEESGLVGATQWANNRRAELIRYSAAIEADMGCIKASGLIMSGSKDATCILLEIMKLFQDMTNSTLLAKMEAFPSNMMPIHAHGVPTITLIGDNEKSEYWETQHTYLDAMTSLNPDEMDKCLAIMASVTYVLADMRQKLPRREIK